MFSVSSNLQRNSPAIAALDRCKGCWANIGFQNLKGNEAIFGMASLGAGSGGGSKHASKCKKCHFYVPTKLPRPAHLQWPPPLEYNHQTDDDEESAKKEVQQVMQLYWHSSWRRSLHSRRMHFCSREERGICCELVALYNHPDPSRLNHGGRGGYKTLPNELQQFQPEQSWGDIPIIPRNLWIIAWCRGPLSMTEEQRNWKFHKGRHPLKNVYFRALHESPTPIPPIRATLSSFLGREKQCFARMTENKFSESPKVKRMSSIRLRSIGSFVNILASIIDFFHNSSSVPVYRSVRQSDFYPPLPGKGNRFRARPNLQTRRHTEPASQMIEHRCKLSDASKAALRGQEVAATALWSLPMFGKPIKLAVKWKLLNLFWPKGRNEGFWNGWWINLQPNMS